MATDYHMHLERGPWTLDWLRRFVETARARGLAEIGISEHPPVPGVADDVSGERRPVGG